MNSDLRPVRSVLAALRGRLRRETWLRAAGWVVGVTCVALVLSFALDYVVELPWGVRAVHLGLLVAGLIALTVWATAPLRTPLEDVDLAQALEAAVPRLGDRVASALDFERRLDEPAEQESRAMMRIVIRQAAAAVQNVRPGDLVETRPSRRALALAGTALLVLGITALSMSDEFGTWVRRGLLLDDIAWPRRTHVRVLGFPADGPLAVTHGQDLQITAEIDGEIPREVILHYEALEVTDGEDPVVTETDVRRMFAIEDEDGATGRFAFQFRAISTSFRLWVTGGDDNDRDPVYEVRAMVPPRLASITARVTYPEHSGLPPAVVRETSFEVLRGSSIDMRLQANMPLASAQMVPSDGPVTELEVSGENRDTLRLDLSVVEDLQFQVRLTAVAGQSNREEDDRFLVRALADRAPDVRVLFPLGRLYRTPNGIVPVKAVVTDDFGLVSAELETALGDDVRIESLLADAAPAAPDATDAAGTTADAPAPRPLPKRIDGYRPVEIAALTGSEDAPVRAGDLVRLVLRATDNAGQETASPEITVEILAPEDLERRLGQRQVSLRDQLTQLRSHQRRTLDGIRRLRSALDEGAGNRDGGRDLQVEQGRVTGEISQFLRGIHGVFDAYVLNRLGGLPTIDRILPLYHEALSGPADDAASVFPSRLYAAIVEETRQKRLFDPEVLGALLEIMDLGQACELDASPAVYDALRTWAAGDAGPEMVAEAERRSEDLEDKLRELDRRMDQWEAMSELVELLRQVRNRQDELAKPVKERNVIEGR